MTIDSDLAYALYKANQEHNVEKVLHIVDELGKDTEFLQLGKIYPAQPKFVNIQNELGRFCKSHPEHPELLRIFTSKYKDTKIQPSDWQSYVKVLPNQERVKLLSLHIEAGYKLDKWINFCGYEMFSLKPSETKKILKRDPYLYIRAFMKMSDAEYEAYSKGDGMGRSEWINKHLLNKFPDFHTDNFSKWWSAQDPAEKARVYMICATIGNPKHFKKLARLDEGIPSLKTITSTLALLDAPISHSAFHDLLVTSKTEEVALPTFEF